MGVSDWKESVTGRKVEKLLLLPKAVERHWIKKLQRLWQKKGKLTHFY